ncbi:hypothetical protein [Pontibacillus salipaludis]|uniref:Uncharacterized protein n=1 Tax=Pontibacillus salipaludis TaxID=1697394 RepID=A0ABQ1PWE8_9BACI|nr:hypothetical protein [Pontibacillus salipaludis]GGD05265.1 hypothetical protein GCM10011389_10970 [Pontibacillus salipaludis]
MKVAFIDEFVTLEEPDELQAWKSDVVQRNQLVAVQLKRYNYKYQPEKRMSRGKTRQ